MTAGEFDQIVREWIDSAKHPKTGRLYTEMAYQPMLEVLTCLRANGFKTFIVSGDPEPGKRLVWIQTSGSYFATEDGEAWTPIGQNDAIPEADMLAPTLSTLYQEGQSGQVWG